jgi:hypothetical protein
VVDVGKVTQFNRTIFLVNVRKVAKLNLSIFVVDVRKVANVNVAIFVVDLRKVTSRNYKPVAWVLCQPVIDQSKADIVIKPGIINFATLCTSRTKIARLNFVTFLIFQLLWWT